MFNPDQFDRGRIDEKGFIMPIIMLPSEEEALRIFPKERTKMGVNKDGSFLMIADAISTHDLRYYVYTAFHLCCCSIMVTKEKGCMVIYSDSRILSTTFCLTIHDFDDSMISDYTNFLRQRENEGRDRKKIIRWGVDRKFFRDHPEHKMNIEAKANEVRGKFQAGLRKYFEEKVEWDKSKETQYRRRKYRATG